MGLWGARTHLTSYKSDVVWCAYVVRYGVWYTCVLCICGAVWCVVWCACVVYVCGSVVWYVYVQVNKNTSFFKCLSRVSFLHSYPLPGSDCRVIRQGLEEGCELENES